MLLQRGPIPFAQIYLGAITTLKNTKSPERIPQAAHSIRELIEKLPSRLEINRAKVGDVSHKVNLLRESWEKTLEESGSYEGKIWEGEIDAPLLGFLDELQGFFCWFRTLRPAAKKVDSQVIRKLEISNIPLPDFLHDKNVTILKKTREYFVDIAHHRVRNIGQEEFESKLDGFELFLLQRFIPKPTADFRSIDVLIGKGEQDAR